MTRSRQLASFLAWSLLALPLAGAEIVIPLPAGVTVEHRTSRFQCDAAAVALGLPAVPFNVDYINASPNALAVLPLNGKPLIFSNVISGSGARYAANRYIWWDAGSRGITLSAPSADGTQQRGLCQSVPARKSSISSAPTPR